MSVFIEDAAFEEVFPALEIRIDTGEDVISKFAERFHDRSCVVVHRYQPHSISDLYSWLRPLEGSCIHVLVQGAASLARFRGLPALGRALVNDGFNVTVPNADYPPRSHFDDLVHRFRGEGFDAFGDFATVGDRFPTGGGTPNAVAIHLTEIVADTIETNHFVTPPEHTFGDIREKYLAAVEQMVEYTTSRPGFDTIGAKAFQDTWARQHYPGSRLPKRWSILHHFEIIEREMAKMGLQPFL